MEKARVDRWLWAIRLAKTRSDATAWCKGGHVSVNGRTVKPSASVVVGDRIEARVHQRDRIVEVTRVIDTRVGAKIAVDCYTDHSPPEPERGPFIDGSPQALRDPGAGRPTKRDRRQIERWKAENR